MYIYKFFDDKDPLNSKYYAVCVQYTSKLNTQKLMNFVRSLKNKTISKKHYNFRLASPEVIIYNSSAMIYKYAYYAYYRITILLIIFKK